MRKLLFLALLPLLLWGDAHIFVYHRFGDSKHTSTNTSIDVLRAEFEYFKKHGYEVIPLKRLSDAFRQGHPIKENWVILTIDDSYKSFYDNGLPLFKEYGYPFTLFVYIEATDKSYGDFMSWEQIREAAKYGEIGLHSYGHHHMVSMTPKAIREDTQKGFSSFISHLGKKPKYYAYPFGEYNTNVRAEIEAFGFDLILNQNSGAVDHQSDPNDLDRTALTGQNLVEKKLRIKTLPTTWISPKKWPENDNLKLIHATISPDIKSLEYYISGYGWHRVKAENGVVKTKLDIPLKLKRTRLFLKYGNQQSSIILVKEKQ